MKSLLVALFFASAIFLIIDVLWLSFSVKNFYKPHLGTLLNEKPVMWAAALFYMIYMIGLAVIILQPSLKDYSISHAFWSGMIFGLVAYGTYNLTNMATIKNWSTYVVFVDMIWGSILTGTSAALSIYITKKILV